MHREGTGNSLQQRVNDYLREKTSTYVVQESNDEAIADIFTSLKKAERDLKAAQDRVDRLKWELARVQSGDQSEA